MTGTDERQFTQSQKFARNIAERVRKEYIRGALTGALHDVIITELVVKWNLGEDQINNYRQAKGNKCLAGLSSIPHAKTLKRLDVAGLLPEWIKVIANGG